MSASLREYAESFLPWGPESQAWKCGRDNALSRAHVRELGNMKPG